MSPRRDLPVGLSTRLPPGQRSVAWSRFGLPRFAHRVAPVPERPVLQVRGAVAVPLDLDVAELHQLTRYEQTSTLHCVTTWSTTGLTWSGVRFAEVLGYLTELAEPAPTADWLLLRGLDGYRCCLHRADARRPSVLLADRLDGRPLTAAEGAPLRLVAPELYGYKGVRQLVGVEFATQPRAGSAGWAEHPRGRVALEERSPLLPGALWRVLWRAALPWVRLAYPPAPTGGPIRRQG